jgi:hypothetical protein
VVRRYEAAEPERWHAALSGRHAPDRTLVSHVESVIPQLRELDDAAAAHGQLDYVDAHLRVVARLVKSGMAASGVDRRLLLCLGHLGQLAGWMAFELGDQRSAQVYFLAGLRAARGASDAPLGAHILADMAYQAASLGRGRDAVTLATAAERAVTGAAPLERACVLGRVGYAWAVVGDEAAFQTARGCAEDAFSRAEGMSREGDWAYYLTEQHLTVQAGYSLAALGRRRSCDGSGRATSLLREGSRLLDGAGREGYGGGPPNPRKSGFELAWSALTQVYRDDLEGACAAGASALSHYTSAPTARTQRALREVQGRLRLRKRNAYVRDFLPHLDRVFPPHS